MARTGEIPFRHYYGTVDATPLFVALAGAYHRRTGDTELIRRIWPQLMLALQWIDMYGDVDGDGFVEYARQSKEGLVQQGWKDSADSIFHSDGQLADAPIALCEVQGYVYQAKSAGAELARHLGEPAMAERLENEARTSASASTGSSGAKTSARMPLRSMAASNAAACLLRMPGIRFGAASQPPSMPGASSPGCSAKSRSADGASEPFHSGSRATTRCRTTTVRYGPMTTP